MKLNREDIDLIAAAVVEKLLAVTLNGPRIEALLPFDAARYKAALQEFRRGDRKTLRKFLAGRDLAPLAGKKI